MEVDIAPTKEVIMKHPSPHREAFEFNLGHALLLRCVHHQSSTVCGECEACLITNHLNQVKQWFFRAGDESRKRFVLGLVRRLHSADLLQQLVRFLQPLLCKDFMYARSRTNPSLGTDRRTMSADRAVGGAELEALIAQAWYWFQGANYWTKWNFLLGMLRECEAHLLHIIGSQARTLHAAEQNASHTKVEEAISTTDPSFYTTDLDPASLPEAHELTPSEYSTSVIYGAATEPERPNDLTFSIIQSSSQQRHDVTSSSQGRQSQYAHRLDSSTASACDREVINDDSGDEDGDPWAEAMQDPTCMVIPTSAKAHAGVCRYKDFIRCLPVHLSKLILGFLDQVSLFNCLCVSKFWRECAEGVQREHSVCQNLREEVMLMQGAGAQSCNPVYAKDVDVAVPNLVPGTFDTIRVGELMEPNFKTDVNFNTAYTGYSTRNIIMEERNIYCGAYNVMVLRDQYDPHRVMHTDGGDLIALGSQDRRLRFIYSGTGKEAGLVISGHSGSVRCVVLHEAQGYVLSGSYDTSIRCWSLETGKCQRIFRGHQDTVTCMERCGDSLASGSRDRMCKVWNIMTGKCIRTFKHRHPITAVALAEEICISGCEGGKTKVWELKSGKLIKCLVGHREPVTIIRFDRWHIITGSCDGYALAWSAQGNHRRCLTAFRHPKAVLCLEFHYLRVVTGSEDGKLRIWNMVSGQCLRIMRGNSRSDPISSLIAIGNKVTLNTANTMLVLSFEPVNWDYTLEDDKMPPMVQYSHYGSAPVRLQSYPYIRAQRMIKAGAANTKILHRDEDEEEDKGSTESSPRKATRHQTPHSAKTLSKKSMAQARQIQSAGARLDGATGQGPEAEVRKAASHVGTAASRPTTAFSQATGRATSAGTRPATALSNKSLSMSSRPPPSKGPTSKSRATSARSATVVSVAGFQVERPDDDSEATASEPEDMRRRVSWAFQHPPGLPLSTNTDLKDTKALLRSQIRARGDVVPPDFIYLAVNAIQANMKCSEAGRNMEHNRRQHELSQNRQSGRPSSCPSRLDPRTMVPVTELGLDDFRIEDGRPPPDLRSEMNSRMSEASVACHRQIPPSTSTLATQKYTTNFVVTPVTTKHVPHSLHPADLPSSIPKGRLVRPHTASRIPIEGRQECVDERQKGRPHSAVVLHRPGTAQTTTSVATRTRNRHGYRSSATECSVVPMLMYPKDFKDKLANLRQKRLNKCGDGQIESRIGNVSTHNSPLRNQMAFKLRTHDQVEEELESIARTYQERQRQQQHQAQKQQQQAWLTKVRSQLRHDACRPRSATVDRSHAQCNKV